MDPREQTLAHLRTIAAWPGYWELRALRRMDGNRMESRGSFYVIAAAHGEQLIYDRLEEAIDWASEQTRNGGEIFIGMNPRAREGGKSKDSVGLLTAAFVDLDLPDGETIDSALAQVTDGDAPLPSLVVNSGYGLHVLYLLSEPTGDKVTWRKVQRGLVRRWADLGADAAVASDESRVLRLVPFPNRKRWPDGVPTELLYQSENRYTLEQLADIFTRGTAFSPNEVLSFHAPTIDDGAGDLDDLTPDDEDHEALAARAERNRAILDGFIVRNFTNGIHFGIFPVDGQDITKPTLLKPGAELVAQLYRWRFAFAADLDTLSMNGPAGGVFAYICYVLDRHGRPVGQGRGVAELRELGMNNANKTVKIAEKRAMVDAVLRTANLSSAFTQDLEEVTFIAPEATTPIDAPARGNGRAARAGPLQANALRLWLHQARQSERHVAEYYGVSRLEDLPKKTADQLLARLQELAQAKHKRGPA